MNSQREIDFYDRIAEKLGRELIACLDDKQYDIAYSRNKLLPQMIKEIQDKLFLNTETLYPEYVPDLKLDILFGVKRKNNERILFILLEVKYATKLTLMDYSQLAGYLTVARIIPMGLLFLVRQPNGNSFLSDDFSKILSMKSLPMNFDVTIKDVTIKDESETFNLNFGICCMASGSGINWQDTSASNGIKDTEDLASRVRGYLAQ